MSSDWPLYFLIFGPALLGLVALGGAIALLGGAKREGSAGTIRLVAGVVLLILALGVGGCYGVMLFGGLGLGL